MTSFTFRMPAGIPGDPNRSQSLTIEPAVITPFGTTGAPTTFGIPIVLDNTTHNVRTMIAGDTVAYGLLVREFPAGATQDGLGTSTPPTSGQCSIMKRGYMTVLLSGSTAATKGGQAYIWTAAASGSHIVAGWEASSPGGSGITATGAYFMGPADANNNVEIAWNL